MRRTCNAVRHCKGFADHTRVGVTTLARDAHAGRSFQIPELPELRLGLLVQRRPAQAFPSAIPGEHLVGGLEKPVANARGHGGPVGPFGRVGGEIE